MRSGKIPRRAGRQRGATAVEFALLFPFLFAVVYGGITYGFVFFLQQRVNFAAQEGVRAAVAFNPASADYTTSLNSAVSTAVIQSFSATGTAPAGLLPTTAQPGEDANTIQVTVQYAVGTLFPTINVPLIGPVPKVPPVLTAVATGRVS